MPRSGGSRTRWRGCARSCVARASWTRTCTVSRESSDSMCTCTCASSSRETVLGLVLELLAEPEFAAGPSAGLVLQAYLRDSQRELDQILGWVARTPREPPLTIRLVKGAYWDHEVVEARLHGWEVPVFETRAECDRNFESLTRRLLREHPSVRVALGSHN